MDQLFRIHRRLSTAKLDGDGTDRDGFFINSRFTSGPDPRSSDIDPREPTRVGVRGEESASSRDGLPGAVRSNTPLRRNNFFSVVDASRIGPVLTRSVGIRRYLMHPSQEYSARRAPSRVNNRDGDTGSIAATECSAPSGLKGNVRTCSVLTRGRGETVAPDALGVASGHRRDRTPGRLST